MTPSIFAVAALLAGAASLFASRAWLRSCAYVCLVAALCALWWTALGHPRPALFGMPKGTVVSYALNEPKSIDVQVKPPHGGEPILWSLPWNEQQADALQKAWHDAQKKGLSLQMKPGKSGHGRGYGALLHNETPMFYPAPNPQLPEKTRP